MSHESHREDPIGPKPAEHATGPRAGGQAPEPPYGAAPAIRAGRVTRTEPGLIALRRLAGNHAVALFLATSAPTTRPLRQSPGPGPQPPASGDDPGRQQDPDGPGPARPADHHHLPIDDVAEVRGHAPGSDRPPPIAFSGRRQPARGRGGPAFVQRDLTLDEPDPEWTSPDLTGQYVATSEGISYTLQLNQAGHYLEGGCSVTAQPRGRW